MGPRLRRGRTDGLSVRKLRTLTITISLAISSLSSFPPTYTKSSSKLSVATADPNRQSGSRGVPACLGWTGGWIWRTSPGGILRRPRCPPPAGLPTEQRRRLPRPPQPVHSDEPNDPLQRLCEPLQPSIQQQRGRLFRRPEGCSVRPRHTLPAPGWARTLRLWGLRRAEPHATVPPDLPTPSATDRTSGQSLHSRTPEGAEPLPGGTQDEG